MEYALNVSRAQCARQSNEMQCSSQCLGLIVCFSFFSCSSFVWLAVHLNNDALCIPTWSQCLVSVVVYSKMCMQLVILLFVCFGLFQAWSCVSLTCSNHFPLIEYFFSFCSFFTSSSFSLLSVCKRHSHLPSLSCLFSIAYGRACFCSFFLYFPSSSSSSSISFFCRFFFSSFFISIQSCLVLFLIRLWFFFLLWFVSL